MADCVRAAGLRLEYPAEGTPTNAAATHPAVVVDRLNGGGGRGGGGGGGAVTQHATDLHSAFHISQRADALVSSVAGASTTSKGEVFGVSALVFAGAAYGWWRYGRGRRAKGKNSHRSD